MSVRCRGEKWPKIRHTQVKGKSQIVCNIVQCFHLRSITEGNWIKTLSMSSILCASVWRVNGRSSDVKAFHPSSDSKLSIILLLALFHELNSALFPCVRWPVIKCVYFYTESAFIRTATHQQLRQTRNIIISSSKKTRSNKTITLNDITIHKSPSYGKNMIKWTFMLSRCSFFCSAIAARVYVSRH